MTMKKVILGALFAITLAGCSSDDNNTLVNLADLRRPISVEVSENPIQNTGTEARDNTRASITTTDNLNSFKMNYGKYYHYTVTKNQSGDWDLDPGHWPYSVAASQNITFHAYNYNVGTFYANDSDPYISVTMQKNASDLNDVIVAERTTNLNANSGKVYLTFDHACAAVDFTIRKTKDKTIVLKSATLQNVSKHGEYHYNSKTWTNVGTTVGTTTYYTLTNGDITLTMDKQALPHNTYFFIPQTLASLKVVITVDGELKHGTITLNKELKAGKRYPIDIELGTGL